MLEENGEKQLDGQSDKRWGVAKSPRGKDYIVHYYQQESQLDRTDLSK